MPDLPTKQDNPNGLHQRYNVTNADGTPAEGTYIVLRIDNAGKDKIWARACRYATRQLCQFIRDWDREAEHLQQFAKDLRIVLERIDAKHRRYIYVGDNPGLKGLTALGVYVTGGTFTVQVDNLSHEWSKGWHETNRNDWMLIYESLDT